MNDATAQHTAVLADEPLAPLGQTERLAQAGAYAEALQVLDRALPRHAGDARVHAARGWMIENIEPVRLDEARAAYETAISLDPQEPWAGLGLATVLGRLGDTARSEALHRELVERTRPQAADAPELLELLGWCLYRLGRLDEAAEVFGRALAVDGDWVSVRFDLGLVWLQRGEAEAAAAEFRHALQALDGRPAQARAAALRLALEDLDDASLRHSKPAALPATTALRAQLADALAHCHD